MTAAGPVSRVTALLGEAEYELIEQPEVAGIPFRFDATLAVRDSLDLVVVVDLAMKPDEDRVRRAVEAFARALDLVRSRRSLTVVLVGPAPHPGLIRAVAHVARILRVPPDRDDGDLLRESLSVLLPLEAGGLGAEKVVDVGWSDTRRQLIEADEEIVGPVLEAAARGDDVVSRAAADVLGAPIDRMDSAEGDDAR
jgi:hypothetical protein